MARAEQDGETILLDQAGGAYYVLNATAALIWDEVLAGATVDELVAAVHTHFEAPADQVRGDVMSLLDGLRRARLIRWS